MSTAMYYSVIATFGISLIAFVGLLTLSVKKKWLNKMLFFLISLSAGALLGDVFFHLLPEHVDSMGGFTVTTSVMILVGIVCFFILEKFVIWHHHHDIETPDEHGKDKHAHDHTIGIMSLAGDAFHNLLDGMIIGASFLISPVVGLGTTVAVLLHEIPQELGDFGVLIHAEFSVKKALFFNFLTGTVAILGAVIAVYLGGTYDFFLDYLIPLTAGGFIYIAGSDLIPELKKEGGARQSLIQLISLLLGMGLMLGLAVWGT